MNRIFRTFAWTVFLWLIALTVYPQFQPSEVIRTQEKTIKNGTVYYIHTVREGQTFFSICRAYDANREIVERENPGLDPEHLKPGQAVWIPETAIQVRMPYPVNRDDFYELQVKKKHTVFSIARRYNVDEETIYYYNPWAKNGIQVGQTLWIPRAETLTKAGQEPQDTVHYFYYTLKEQDTLYSISRYYGVTVADIIYYNPVLREGMHPGQTLMIPKPGLMITDSTVTEESLTVDVWSCLPVDEMVTYDVALLLPFFADHIMGLSHESQEKDTLVAAGTDVYTQIGMSFTEFYEGFLLAVDSLKHTGLSIKLHLYDTERDFEKLVRIQRELLMLQPDLIIGPVYTEHMSAVSRLAMYQDINIISPLSTSKSLVNGNERLFQVVPSKEAENVALIEYLKQYEKTGQFILIRSADSLSMNDSKHFKMNMLNSMPLDTIGNSPRFRDYVLTDTLMENFEKLLEKILTKDKDNFVIVFSSNEADVIKLISRLYVLSDKENYPIRLFGQPEWQTWQGIDLSHVHQLQLTLFTPFYTDFSDHQTAGFLRKCRDWYKYEPYGISPQGYNYCMLGYDIGLYFLSALKKYGKNFEHCLHMLNNDLLLSSYRFQKTEKGGYENRYVSFIRYNPDFTIEKIQYRIPATLAEQQE